MAGIKSADIVDVPLTVAELELIERALRLVENFGLVDDEGPARDLLRDLEAIG
ncbi:hypothetical protein SPW_7336 [Streptomyces sp. W007]|uniref:hypothetical protein n=1 Tax=Streptomyces sp. W007 TaxID=1055352 RepID=UPI000241A777|nr:hypothetical protein [Streptomyces sp. W007]EHM24242.1 hypothetical protein SPW_7336 [Streptomyces sp. W007]